MTTNDSKTTFIPLLVIVGAVAIMGPVAFTYQMDAGDIAADAVTGDERRLDQIREKVLKEMSIPDGYFIDMTGDAWVSYHGSQEQADKITNMYRKHVASTNSSMSDFYDRLMTRSINFRILAENPDFHPDEVVALAVARQQMTGAYDTPSEPVAKYHEYILAKYHIPDTLHGVQERLAEATGEMLPLLPIYVEVRNTYAAHGILPTELTEQNPGYWSAVSLLADCKIHRQFPCEIAQDRLDNRRWEEPKPPFIPPPGEVWPPVFDFILPAAYGSNPSYDRIWWQYHHMVNNCGMEGDACEDSEEDYYTGYKTGSYSPDDDHLTGTDIETWMSVVPTAGGADTVAYLARVAAGPSTG